MIDLRTIHHKWQKKRADTKLYRVVEDPKKPKYYVLDMFPYPSGAGLHVGHPKGYVASDVLARKKMLEGYCVLHPMGFDTFGLGTENYAIKHKKKPQVVAKENIENFINQLKQIGLTYDWERMINTADPKYYKWTQRIFLQLYHHYYDEQEQKAKPIEELRKKIEKGEVVISEDIETYLDKHRLAYVDYKPINWCPECKTGLANEDLDDGKCERCGSPVEQRPMKQRVLRITKYAERLLSGLDTLNWDESMKELQRNWIGKSLGTEFEMEVVGVEEKISIYTTRIDTVFGMSFVAVAPEHPIVPKLTTREQEKQVLEYIEQAKHKTNLERISSREKTGVFTGSYAINPFTNEKVPIRVADYVLASYGTGVVMGVPAHDERDWEFASKYNLPIRQAIAPLFTFSDHRQVKDAYQVIKKSIGLAVMKNPKDNTYLCLERKADNAHTFPGGEVQQGEDIIDGIKRELLEETGYKNIRFMKKLPTTSAYFWHETKKQNYFTIQYSCYFELLDEDRQDVAVEEMQKHTPVWISEQEMKSFLANDPDQLYIFESLLFGEKCFTGKGVLVDSGEFTGLTSDEAIPAMQARLEKKGIGGKKVQYKMQDRVFSRQRYWGEPFPIIRKEEHYTVGNEKKVRQKAIPLSFEELPLELPDVEHYEPTGTEEGPLALIDEWVNVTLPDGSKGRRETNTMPGWAGSSRYWLRYMDPHNDTMLVSPEREKYRGAVDMYVGGAEHVTRHMIYARFWQKFLYDIGVVTHDEPFLSYQSVGLIMGEDGRKMSKRWGNVINPDDVIREYGADAFRTYEMFMGPFTQPVARSTNGLKGVYRFLEKVVKLLEKERTDVDDHQTLVLLHQTIKKVSEDIDAFKHNTAVAQLMILTNHLSDCTRVSKKTLETLALLLAPFAPHLAEEMREVLGHTESIFRASWPTYDPSMLADTTIDLPVQINGKTRGNVVIQRTATQEEIMQQIQADSRFARYLTGTVKKVIYVPEKIISIVVE